MAPEILVVGADEFTRRRCEDVLSSAGYTLHFADDLSAALSLVRREYPALILLDITRMSDNFFAFIATVRVESNLPIVLRVPPHAEKLASAGLAHGADDYLLTDTGAKEMAARLQAILRRHQNFRQTSGVIRVGDVVINPEKRTVHVNHIPLDLTPTEFDLLAILMSAPQKIFSRRTLRRSVPSATTDRAITAHIRNLRLKITPHTNSPPIQTIYGRGYRFLPEDDD